MIAGYIIAYNETDKMVLQPTKYLPNSVYDVYAHLHSLRLSLLRSQCTQCMRSLFQNVHWYMNFRQGFHTKWSAVLTASAVSSFSRTLLKNKSWVGIVSKSQKSLEASSLVASQIRTDHLISFHLYKYNINMSRSWVSDCLWTLDLSITTIAL